MAKTYAIPATMVIELAFTQMLDMHDDNGPGEVVCPLCLNSMSMRWRLGNRVDDPSTLEHDSLCPVRWARQQLSLSYNGTQTISAAQTRRAILLNEDAAD